jgi:hypothetical protein
VGRPDSGPCPGRGGAEELGLAGAGWCETAGVGRHGADLVPPGAQLGAGQISAKIRPSGATWPNTSLWDSSTYGRVAESHGHPHGQSLGHERKVAETISARSGRDDRRRGCRTRRRARRAAPPRFEPFPFWKQLPRVELAALEDVPHVRTVRDLWAHTPVDLLRERVRQAFQDASKCC